MKNRIYVGNLPWEVTDDALTASFAAFGNVTEVKIIMDRETGRPRGFAFVTMSSDSEATAAIEGLHGTDFGGRSLKVNIAEDKRGGGNRHSSGGRDARW